MVLLYWFCDGFLIVFILFKWDVTINKLPNIRRFLIMQGIEDNYMQPYPSVCKEANSVFEPMTNQSPGPTVIAAPGFTLFS